MRMLLPFLLVTACLLGAGCSKEDPTPVIIRLGLLGDSITSGKPGNNYPEVLDKILPDYYILTNYGVPRTCLVKNCFSPIWETDQFKQLLMDESNVITIMLGTNDTNTMNSNAVRANYESNYREMIDLFQGFSSQPDILLCYPPPLYALDPVADSLIRNEIIPIINRIAADYQLKVVDTYYLVDDYPANYPDKLHPDKAGVATLARIIADALED